MKHISLVVIKAVSPARVCLARNRPEINQLDQTAKQVAKTINKTILN